jgi:hypothetical protein
MFLGHLFSIVVLTALLIRPQRVSADLTNAFCGKDKTPDGSAIIQMQGGKEIFILFKGNQLWMTDLETFVNMISNPEENLDALFSLSNGLSASKIFPKYPREYKRVVGFSGLEQSHPFYNSILVFRPSGILHYRVKQISISFYSSTKAGHNNVTIGPNDLKYPDDTMHVTLEGEHDISSWPMLDNNLGNVQTFYTIRGTRMLAYLSELDSQKVRHKAVYLLNKNNLDGPINAHSFGAKWDFRPFSTEVLIHHQLADGRELDFTKDGRVCVKETKNPKCVSFDKFVNCDPLVEVVQGGFSQWLHKEARLTFRLISIALIASMMMSSAVAFSFTYTQVNKMLMLT